jgi:hypothetical protein
MQPLRILLRIPRWEVEDTRESRILVPDCVSLVRDDIAFLQLLAQ